MKKLFTNALIFLFLSFSLPGYALLQATVQNAFRSDSILKYARLTDDYIRLVKHPDYWNNTVVGGKSRPSNIWTRGVFYEGHMALYQISPDTALFNYAYNWGKNFNWQVAYGSATSTSADDQCCGQTYLQLYQLKPSANMLTGIKACLDNSIASKNYTYWWWVDAIQMAMPAYALLGTITKDTMYYDFMYKSYSNSRSTADVTGLFNVKDGLWWRGKNFNPPIVNANGKNIYWSRGNGWAYAALTRVLAFLPKSETHYQEYLRDFKLMSAAIIACQRNDGFWNANLADTVLYAGKETSGTGLFVYGLAWGINNGILDRTSYLNAVKKGWLAIQNDAIHPNGLLGWVQGTGDDPSDNYPFGYNIIPSFEDFGAGCVLLGAAESWKLSKTLEKEDSIANNLGKVFVQPIQYQYRKNLFCLETTVASSLSIHQINGQIMFQSLTSPSSETKVDLNSWPKGVYLVRIRSSKGIQTLKIMR